MLPRLIVGAILQRTRLCTAAGFRDAVLIKDPPFLFLDEATNALDAYNEKIITNNLRPFMDTRTVIIVAHRLNTVMNADYIYVLDNGRIVEEGTHIDLVKKQSYYYKLIKNQLELGE